MNHHPIFLEVYPWNTRVLGYTVNGDILGSCIGHKRIIALPPDTKEIVLEITKAKDAPMLRGLAVYGWTSP